MSTNNQKIVGFLRKNVNYIIFLLCLAVITTVTIILVVNSNNKTPTFNDATVNEQDKNNDSNGNENNGNENNGNENNGGEQTPPENEPSEDTAKVIVFDMPVAGYTIIKDYVGNGVVYNQTLNSYSGHKAIDFSAEEGTSVMACYDGTIKAIEESKLNGITVTIDHGNGLLTLYNSIEIVDGLEVGKQVSKGEIIGVISTNNRLEYKDGPHLHFEVKENGEKIDPDKYFMAQEK